MAGNFRGSALPYTPKYQAAAGFNYEAPIGRVQAFAGADLTFRSDTTSIIGGSRLYGIKDYALLDLRVGVKDSADRWRFELWGKNVTNEYYWTNVSSFFDTVNRWAGMPATYGASVSFRIE